MKRRAELAIPGVTFSSLAVPMATAYSSFRVFAGEGHSPSLYRPSSARPVVATIAASLASTSARSFWARSSMAAALAAASGRVIGTVLELVGCSGAQVVGGVCCTSHRCHHDANPQAFHPQGFAVSGDAKPLPKEPRVMRFVRAMSDHWIGDALGVAALFVLLFTLFIMFGA